MFALIWRGSRLRLFRYGRSQAVRIPREFELPGQVAIIRREGRRLVLEAAPKGDLVARVEALLETLDVLLLEGGADPAYARIRTELERAGLPIGANDLLIAAHAMVLGCTLVTGNHREFGRIRGLRVQGWA